MISKKFFIEYVAAFILLIGYSSIYQVSDHEHALCIRNNPFFNLEPSGVLIKTPGLHFKIPILDHIVFLDKRIQRVRIRSHPLIMEDNDSIKVDYLINWRIQDAHRYMRFMYHNQYDCSTILTQWSNQFLHRHWTALKITDSTQPQFEMLKKYLIKNTQNIGAEITDCEVLQKIPTPNTRKKMLQNMRVVQAELARKILHDSQLRAHVLDNQSKAKQAILLAQAQLKTQDIRNEGETLAMRIYLEAYRQAPEFAHFYQNLHKKVLLDISKPIISSHT